MFLCRGVGGAVLVFLRRRTVGIGIKRGIVERRKEEKTE
jgi:hypothetical protein